MSQKNEFKPHLKKCWCIPAKQSAAFVAAMEDVLTVYARPYDEDYPVVCLDEKPVQFFDEVRKGFRKHGVEYYDNEYIRNGTACIFLFNEPLAGWRYTDSQERRTTQDWAGQIEWLVDEQYPDAKKIVLVMDNLNIHTTASLYDTFPPEKARRLASRLEIHYTPKHGSWLNMAECELSALGRQCLGTRRIPDLQSLRDELNPWCHDRNEKQKGIDWQFTTEDARVKPQETLPHIGVLDVTRY
jgi:transposase